MLFRKRVWYSNFHLKGYCKNQEMIEESLQKLKDKGFINTPDDLFSDLYQMRIFLESLSSEELYNLSQKIQKKMMKYPPTYNNSMPNFNGADMESPLVVLKPFKHLSDE